MKVPKITSKQAEEAVKKHSFKIDASHKFSKKRIKKADKFEKKHGFRYEDAWNLDHAIALFILPRLVQLRDVGCGIPCEFLVYDENGNPVCNKETDKLAAKKWRKTLNKMIYAFYLIVTDDFIKPDSDESKAVNEGLDLFREYYFDLWD